MERGAEQALQLPHLGSVLNTLVYCLLQLWKLHLLRAMPGILVGTTQPISLIWNEIRSWSLIKKNLKQK